MNDPHITPCFVRFSIEHHSCICEHHRLRVTILGCGNSSNRATTRTPLTAERMGVRRS
ncbi:hypothetical protein ABIB26_002991 [Arthrobacter sp. UYEF20]